MECIKKEQDCPYRFQGGCDLRYCQKTLDDILEALQGKTETVVTAPEVEIVPPKIDPPPAEPTEEKPEEPESTELPDNYVDPVVFNTKPKKRGRKKKNAE
jgi:hypothetical protein